MNGNYFKIDEFDSIDEAEAILADAHIAQSELIGTIYYTLVDQDVQNIRASINLMKNS